MCVAVGHEVRRSEIWVRFCLLDGRTEKNGDVEYRCGVLKTCRSPVCSRIFQAELSDYLCRRHNVEKDSYPRWGRCQARQRDEKTRAVIPNVDSDAPLFALLGVSLIASQIDLSTAATSAGLFMSYQTPYNSLHSSLTNVDLYILRNEYECGTGQKGCWRWL